MGMLVASRYVGKSVGEETWIRIEYSSITVGIRALGRELEKTAQASCIDQLDKGDAMSLLVTGENLNRQLEETQKAAQDIVTRACLD